MFKPFYLVFFVILLSSCKGDFVPKKAAPKNVAQWINPVFYNNDFENEFNFPLWFDDSLVKAHKIYKITKRVFPRITGDTSEINNYKQAIPKEKIEYYFDPNGLVDQMIVYTYFDDREISRATFLYEGNMSSSGFRSIKLSPIMYLKKPEIIDQFSTEIYLDQSYPFSLLRKLPPAKKYFSYADSEKGINYFEVKKRKYWGPLSIDSIIKPKALDWIILGTMRKPYKRYKVENLLNENSVYEYKYWKSGVLRRVIKKVYPFDIHRSFLYGKESEWISYIDSIFSNGTFITKINNQIIFDEYNRPMEILHQKSNESEEGFFYKETLHYRSKNKQ